MSCAERLKEHLKFHFCYYLVSVLQILSLVLLIYSVITNKWFDGMVKVSGQQVTSEAGNHSILLGIYYFCLEKGCYRIQDYISSPSNIYITYFCLIIFLFHLISSTIIWTINCLFFRSYYSCATVLIFNVLVLMSWICVCIFFFHQLPNDWHRTYSHINSTLQHVLTANISDVSHPALHSTSHTTISTSGYLLAVSACLESATTAIIFLMMMHDEFLPLHKARQCRFFGSESWYSVQQRRRRREIRGRRSVGRRRRLPRGMPQRAEQQEHAPTEPETVSGMVAERGRTVRTEDVQTNTEGDAPAVTVFTSKVMLNNQDSNYGFENLKLVLVPPEPGSFENM